MGTNSLIGMVLSDGTVKGISCHWDGYIEYNGKILYEHYTKRKKIDELLNLGDISSLGPEIGTTHDFDDHDNGVCTSYGRDRGEEDTQAQIYSSVEKFLDESYSYVYLYQDEEWYVSSDDKLCKLSEKIKKLKEKSKG